MPPKLPELVKRARRLATERDRLVQELAREWSRALKGQGFSARDLDELWAGLTEEAAAFAWDLVAGVLAHRKELDAEIAALAPEFPIDQMARIDRNVLRIALYELRVSGDAPAGVVIDEAVELAKMFGSEASPKFVNGVLATAIGGREQPSA